jgi:hypothetical protein
MRVMWCRDSGNARSSLRPCRGTIRIFVCDLARWYHLGYLNDAGFSKNEILKDQSGLRQPVRPLDLCLHSTLLGLLRILPGLRGKEVFEAVNVRLKTRWTDRIIPLRDGSTAKCG